MTYDDRQLLQRFLASGASDDFAPIVDQYLNLVYSTARKMSFSDGGQVEDICQTVFADLARKADRIPEATPLSGWLYRHTCFVASNHNRAERRRRERERQALEMSESKSSPDVPNEELHLAMTELPDRDRDALVLRFLDEWDLRRVGERLGISEAAAQKRVARALDKLRAILGRKGITASTATLAVCLGQQVAAAPLAAQTVAVAAVGASTAAGIIPALLEFMKAPLAKVAAVVVIGGGVAASMHQQNSQLADLRKQNTELTAKVAQLSAAETENQALKKQGLSPDEIAELRKKAEEVHALRAEIGKLRQQMREAPASLPATATAQPEEVAEEGEVSDPQFLFTTKIIGRNENEPEAKTPAMIDTLAAVPGSVAIFPTKDLPHIVKAFADLSGFDVLSAPKLISLAGRPAQIRVEQTESIITGFHTRADGARFNLVKTNIQTGITADVLGAKHPNGTQITVQFRVSSFDGYLDDGAGVNKTAVSDGVWRHETVPIVDIAKVQTSVIVADGQSILLPAKSQPAGKDYWFFLTPTLLDASAMASIRAQAPSGPPPAREVTAQDLAGPSPDAALKSGRTRSPGRN